ncbi:unnamed protein product [Lasius platythorax]|uniref:R2 protein n=2 Tax=Lasius TaxID=488720 RepID=A0A0J7NG20_LASNI|nr:r2 protein [Lasius niger]
MQKSKYQRRARWTAEEVALLARKKVELIAGSRPPRFINQELLGFFPHRSLKEIKGRRKRQNYRNLVDRLLQQESEAESDHEDPIIDEPLKEAFLAFFEAMPGPRIQEFQASRLHRIAMEARTQGEIATLHKMALHLREVFPLPRRRPSNDH